MEKPQTVNLTEAEIIRLEDQEKNIAVPFTRIVDNSARLLPHRRRFKEIRTTVHRGQWKLLLGEIEFLIQHGDKSPIVVYAGIADGVLIPWQKCFQIIALLATILGRLS